VFLVRVEVEWPLDGDATEFASLTKGNERAPQSSLPQLATAPLADPGPPCELGSMGGRGCNGSSRAAISSLSLFPWLSIEVFPGLRVPLIPSARLDAEARLTGCEHETRIRGWKRYRG
jgi:hypothetical protein